MRLSHRLLRTLKRQGHPAAGCGRQVSRFLRLCPPCPSFQDLIFRCTGSWLKYYVYVQNKSPLEPDSRNEPTVISASVSQPSAWISRFLVALDRFKSCCARHTPSQARCDPPGQTTGLHLGIKRRAHDAMANLNAGPHLRRSKRIKRA